MSHLHILVYTSQTGFTRRYAEMLAQKTGLPACELGGPAPPGVRACCTWAGCGRAASRDWPRPGGAGT